MREKVRHQIVRHLPGLVLCVLVAGSFAVAAEKDGESQDPSAEAQALTPLPKDLVALEVGPKKFKTLIGQDARHQLIVTAKGV
ncbi:MAG: hypothetical protein MK538_09835, partial [Planctomycetes bacterium]|nr:hypothetical protein [Planctomycetota bacterium]